MSRLWVANKSQNYPYCRVCQEYVHIMLVFERLVVFLQDLVHLSCGLQLLLLSRYGRLQLLTPTTDEVEVRHDLAHHHNAALQVQ